MSPYAKYVTEWHCKHGPPGLENSNTKEVKTKAIKYFLALFLFIFIYRILNQPHILTYYFNILDEKWREFDPPILFLIWL